MCKTKKSKTMGYLFLALMVGLTVLGQLLFKRQVDLLGEIPSDWAGRFSLATRFLLNPWVIAAFASAFLASLTWAAVLTQFELSFAYPFTSLSFVLILIASAVFFGESITAAKVAGIVLIALGILVGSR